MRWVGEENDGLPLEVVCAERMSGRSMSSAPVLVMVLMQCDI